MNNICITYYQVHKKLFFHRCIEITMLHLIRSASFRLKHHCNMISIHLVMHKWSASMIYHWDASRYRVACPAPTLRIKDSTTISVLPWKNKCFGTWFSLNITECGVGNCAACTEATYTTDCDTCDTGYIVAADKKSCISMSPAFTSISATSYFYSFL